MCLWSSIVILYCSGLQQISTRCSETLLLSVACVFGWRDSLVVSMLD